MMGTTSTITTKSMGKIAQCAPAAGAKMWCFFVNSRMPQSGKLPVLYLLTGQKSRFSPPQGRLVATIQVKLCRAHGHLGALAPAKFHLNRRSGVEIRPQNIKNFHLDRFRKFLGVFISLSILHSCFKFHMIRVTCYGVIAEKPRVGILG